MMRHVFAATLALGTISGSAQAMPLAPIGTAANGDVIAVAGGCGAGWHRGPYGGCLRTTPTPPHTPARAAITSAPTAAAGGTGSRSLRCKSDRRAAQFAARRGDERDATPRHSQYCFPPKL